MATGQASAMNYDTRRLLDGVRDMGNRSFSLWENVVISEAGSYVVCWCPGDIFDANCGALNYATPSAGKLRLLSSQHAYVC